LGQAGPVVAARGARAAFEATTFSQVWPREPNKIRRYGEIYERQRRPVRQCNGDQDRKDEEDKKPDGGDPMVSD